MKKIMNNPIIGVTPLYDRERSSYWMIPGYFEGLIRCGAVPVMLPMSSDKELMLSAASKLDGILFTGGQDVSPSLYGEEPIAECGEISAVRDRTESVLLELSMKRGLPILGICRGLQFINVAFGGTLWQDLPTQMPSKTEHHMLPPYDRAVHSVTLAESTPLYSLLEKREIAVNSYHHQAIRSLGRELKAMATAPDGPVEAVFLPDYRFLWAVQWHPELSFEKDENSLKIFKRFTEACLKFHEKNR